jgi:signal transduction histidine kinase/CheY-like chemotaxis protein
VDQAYALVARTRLQGLRTRISLAVFLGAVAFALAPSVWPLIWFLAMIAGQVADQVVYGPLMRDPDTSPSRARRAACIVSAALNTTIYSSIAAYLWFHGGEAGRLFGVVQVAGGLLHVSLHLRHVRAVLLAAAIPHASYLLTLPLADVFVAERLDAFGAGAVVVASLLYIAHLIMSVGESAQLTSELHEARGRAERASAAKSDFLAMISHEIRTPMNAVVAAGTLLRRTELSPRQAEHVGMLEHAGEVLVALLTDMLDIAKIEAGKMVLEEADHPIRAKLQAQAALWRPRAAEKGVELHLMLDPHVPAAIRTDPLRFEQVLFNLLSNAVKFTDAGRIEVRADVWKGSAGPRLRISVVDTGCGIAPEALDRVFQSFEQADAGSTRRHGGTGLGLAISRRLAEMMGGSLTAESTPGAGSTFTFESPLVASISAPAPLKAAVAPRSGRPLTVLVAEDHAVNRRIVALLLEPLGCRLVFANDGGEAVAAAEREAFDVILMDMQMPVLDGVAATGAIRAGTGPNAATPVVAVTANAMEHHRAAWEAAGVRAFLTKPIVPGALFEALSAEGLARAAPRLAEQVQQARTT